jgi:hypothetical protein
MEGWENLETLALRASAGPPTNRTGVVNPRLLRNQSQVFPISAVLNLRGQCTKVPMKALVVFLACQGRRQNHRPSQLKVVETGAISP